MTHNPTDSNGVPYAMSHEVRAEREAIIAYLRDQHENFVTGIERLYDHRHAYAALRAEIQASVYLDIISAMECGQDISLRADPLAVARPSKGPLVWAKSAAGSIGLCVPSRVSWVDAAYLACIDDDYAQAYAEDGAAHARRFVSGVMPERVAKIIEWATEDGYEVPPCPYDLNRN